MADNKPELNPSKGTVGPVVTAVATTSLVTTTSTTTGTEPRIPRLESTPSIEPEAVVPPPAKPVIKNIVGEELEEESEVLEESPALGSVPAGRWQKRREEVMLAFKYVFHTKII